MTKKKRILFLQPSPAPYREALFDVLSEDHRISVLYLASHDKERRWYTKPEPRAWDAHYAQATRYIMRGKVISISICSVIKSLRNVNVVVVCTDRPEVFSHLVAAVYSRLTFRTVYCIVSIYDGYSSAGVNSAKSNRFGIIIDSLSKALCGLLVRLSHGAIAYSERGKVFAEKRGATCTPFAQYFPLEKSYGLITMRDVIKRQEGRLLTERIRITLLGYVNKRKGVVEFLSMISRMGLWLSLEITIAGPISTDDGLIDEIMSFSDKGLIVTGHVDNLDKAAILAKTDVFVFPTLHDSWGHVLVEAMYWGIPAICSLSSESSRDLIVHNVNGWQYTTPDQFLNAIDLAKNRAHYAIVAVEAKRTADAFYKNTLDSWRSLLMG